PRCRRPPILCAANFAGKVVSQRNRVRRPAGTQAICEPPGNLHGSSRETDREAFLKVRLRTRVLTATEQSTEFSSEFCRWQGMCVLPVFIVHGLLLRPSLQLLAMLQFHVFDHPNCKAIL